MRWRQYTIPGIIREEIRMMIEKIRKSKELRLEIQRAFWEGYENLYTKGLPAALEFDSFPFIEELVHKTPREIADIYLSFLSGKDVLGYFRNRPLLSSSRLNSFLLHSFLDLISWLPRLKLGEEEKRISGVFELLREIRKQAPGVRVYLMPPFDLTKFYVKMSGKKVLVDLEDLTERLLREGRVEEMYVVAGEDGYMSSDEEAARNFLLRFLREARKIRSRRRKGLRKWEVELYEVEIPLEMIEEFQNVWRIFVAREKGSEEKILDLLKRYTGIDIRETRAFLNPFWGTPDYYELSVRPRRAEYELIEREGPYFTLLDYQRNPDIVKEWRLHRENCRDLESRIKALSSGIGEIERNKQIRYLSAIVPDWREKLEAALNTSVDEEIRGVIMEFNELRPGRLNEGEVYKALKQWWKLRKEREKLEDRLARIRDAMPKPLEKITYSRMLTI